jgi:DNA-binding CsgD family transcriptional regulator/tetratricopeptide (TPR) repeat protein
MALLARLLEEARAESRTRFAQVTGEPGIGKTFLLSEFGRRADGQGWLVLSGRSSELERELPFGLVIDALDAYLGSLDPQTFERIAPDEMTELAGLFPSLRSLADAPEQPSEAVERFRAHKAVVEMIERLAARQPVLLLLDDLHWADPASIEQAGYVLRRPPEAPVMIVGSFRSGQADPALATAVEGAMREGKVEILELGPLDPEDAAKLVGAATASDGLYESSGGNPFYLLQRARGGERALPASSDGGEGVPAAVSAAIAGELSGLSEPSRNFAQAAAVVGDPFELDLAVETGGLNEATALDALDEMIARDLVRAGEVPRSFQFRHPLVRSAIYQTCSPGTRLAAHQRAAEALSVRGAPASARAHHVEHAARFGDAAAVEVLREAGQQVTGRAPATAARWLGTAVRIMPKDVSPEDRLLLLMTLAEAQGATGQFEAARGTLLEAIELAPDDGPVPRVRLIGACAGIEQLLGRRDDAHRRLMAALGALSDEATPQAASLMIDLSLDCFYGMDYGGMVDWARRAVATARAVDDRPLLTASSGLLAFAATLPLNIAEAEAAAREAAELVDSMADDELALRLDAIGHLAGGLFYLGQYEAALRHAQRGLAVARATGQGELFPILVQGTGNILFTTGRLAEAAEVLDGAIELARTSGSVPTLVWTLLNRNYAAYLAGDIETALACGEQGAQLRRDLDESVIGIWSAAVYGITLLEAGDPPRAVELMSECGDEEPMSKVPGPWRGNWLEHFARAQLALGHSEAAAHAAAGARAVADICGLALPSMAADRAAAALALDRGDAQEAGALALSAAGAAESIGARIDEAFSRMVAGRALAAAEDRDTAIAELERAAAIFQDCGAPRYRDQAEHELRKLGRTVHRRSERGTGEGIESLSGRELEVARLVLDRRTNPEIAAELFLSVKTVESHLRNIFRKLDASSRVEVARIMENADAG